jgi:hypothetical protein
MTSGNPSLARRSGSNYGWGAGAKPDGVVAVTLGVATLVSGTGLQRI